MSLKKALLDEALERLSHRAPADAELAGYLDLPQGLTRWEPARYDPRSQLRGDPLRRRVPPQRLKRIPRAHLLTTLKQHMPGHCCRIDDRDTAPPQVTGSLDCRTVDILTIFE
jgi:hypothetical protein